MTSATEPEPNDEPRILLRNVPWPTYVSLRDAVESSAVKMTYLDGLLEIMTTGREHEVTRIMIARLLELFCLERDIPLFGYGGMTMRSKGKKRGFEPDVWYHRDRDAGEVPDLALEVVISNPLLNKLDVYRPFGVREVWVWRKDTITVNALQGGEYIMIPKSVIFPEVDLDRIAHYASEPDQHGALLAFRAELRKG